MMRDTVPPTSAVSDEAVVDSVESPGRRATSSIASRFTLLTAALAALIAGGFATRHHLLMRTVCEERYGEQLDHEAELVAAYIRGGFERMRQDIDSLRRTPPIDGIIRATQGGGIDGFDGSSLELWKQRLETIFASMLVARPHYTQLRYIGVADGGRELVRVDREGGRPVRIADADLQEKSGEPYFDLALGLARDETGFSHVTANREYGKVTEDSPPTIRIVAPIYDSNDTVFGMVVVNEDYASMLTRALAALDPQWDIAVIDSDGNGLVRERDAMVQFTYASEATESIVDALANAPPAAREVLDPSSDRIARFVDVPLPDSLGSKQIRVATIVPDSALRAHVATATRNDFLLSILAVAFASALGFWSSRNLARPVRSMISAVRNYGDPGFEAALPVGRSDELGEFARAFRDLAAGLDSAKRSEHSAYVRLRAAIDQSVDGFVTIDAKGIILVCNSACERMLGLEPGEVLGRNVKHLMFDDVASHHDGYLLSAMLRHEDESSFPVREVTGRHKSGRPIPIELTVNRVDVHDGILFSAILRDISDRKRRDAERDRLLHELVVSNESLDEFAYIASHDLREPLRAIHNHSTFLAEDFGDELGEAGKNRIARLTYLAQRLDRLVEDLLYFSRLGRNQDARHPTPLGKIVDRVREDLRDHLDETNSTVEIVDELPTVECDSVRIGEVYRHLIVNAIRYNDSESPRVTIGFENGVLYVRDNGIGIAETFHDKIFRIFKRLHPIGTYGEGTGAGLTFVKRIIERHGGKIWIESEPGNGSTFHFTLQSENHENVQAEPTHTDRRG